MVAWASDSVGAMGARRGAALIASAGHTGQLARDSVHHVYSSGCGLQRKGGPYAGLASCLLPVASCFMLPARCMRPRLLCGKALITCGSALITASCPNALITASCGNALIAVCSSHSARSHSTLSFHRPVRLLHGMSARHDALSYDA